MPEHVHLLLSEPARVRLAEAIHFLKLAFAKRARRLRFPLAQISETQVSAQSADANLGHSQTSSFWEKRYHDRNVRDYDEFVAKLDYVHWNPVKRGLVRTEEEWKWSSYRTMRCARLESWRSSRSGRLAIGNGSLKGEMLGYFCGLRSQTGTPITPSGGSVSARPRLAPKVRARTWGTVSLSFVSSHPINNPPFTFRTWPVM
jgi:REP element-mobilizing transposase RayT